MLSRSPELSIERNLSPSNILSPIRTLRKSQPDTPTNIDTAKSYSALRPSPESGKLFARNSRRMRNLSTFDVINLRDEQNSRFSPALQRKADRFYGMKIFRPKTKLEALETSLD